MPDFRVIPSNPVIDTQGYYNEGLGKESATGFGAAVSGLEHGLSFGADLTAKVLETQRLNDPAKLQAEQLQRDLENEKIEQAIKDAQLQYKYDAQFGEAERQGKIDYTQALTAQAGATTNKINIDNELTRKYGDADMQSTIDSRRASTASAYSNIAKNQQDMEFKRKYGAFDTLTEGFNRIDKASGKGKSKGPAEDFINSDGTMKLRSGNVVRIVPDGGSHADPSPQSQLEVARERLAEEAVNLLNNESTGKALKKQNELSTASTLQHMDNVKAMDSLTRNNLTRKTINDIQQSSQMTDFEGKPNYGAILPKISTLNELHKTDIAVEDKQFRSDAIALALKQAAPGGIQEYIDSLPEDEKAAATKVLSDAIVRSGDPTFQTPVQQVILGSGLTPEHASDPDQTISKVNTLISSGTVGIEDPDIKKALRSSEYLIAARNASKNGTQAYNVFTNRIPTGGQGGSDLAGGEAASQKVITFVGADGTESHAPVPTNEVEESQLSLIEEAAKTHSQSVSQQQKASNAVSQLQQSRNERDSLLGANPADKSQQQQQELTPEQGAEEAKFIADNIYASDDDEAAVNIQQRRVLNGLSPLTEEQARLSAGKQTEEKFKFQEKKQKEIDDASKVLNNKREMAQVMTEISNELAKGDIDLAGVKGESFRNWMTNVESSVPDVFDLSNDAEKRLMALSERAKSIAVDMARAEGATAKTMDTNKDIDRVVAGKGSLASDPRTIAAKAEGYRVDVKAGRELNILREELLNRNIKPALFERLYNEYRRVYAPEKVLDTSADRTSEVPALVVNPKHMTAEEYLKRHPMIQRIDKLMGGVTGYQGIDSGDTAGLDVARTPRDKQEADIVGSPPGSSGGSNPPPSNSGGGGGGQTGTPLSPQEKTNLSSEITSIQDQDFYKSLKPEDQKYLLNLEQQLGPEKMAQIKKDVDNQIGEELKKETPPTRFAEGDSGLAPGDSFDVSKAGQQSQSTPQGQEPGKYTSGGTTTPQDTFQSSAQRVLNKLKELPGDFSRGLGVVKQGIESIPDSLNLTEKGKAASREALMQQRLGQSPEARKFIDEQKKIINKDGDSYSRQISEFYERTMHSLTPDFLENITEKARQATILPLMAKAGSVISGKSYDQVLNDLKNIHTAQQESEEDFAVEHPKETIAADTLAMTLAFYLGGKAIDKGVVKLGEVSGITNALKAAAQKNPIIEKAISIITGAPTSRTGAAVKEAGRIVTNAAKDTAIIAAVDSDKFSPSQYGDLFKVNATIHFIASALGPFGALAGRTVKRIAGSSDAAMPLAKEFVNQGIPQERIQQLGQMAQDAVDGKITKDAFFSQLNERERAIIQDIGSRNIGGQEVVNREGPRIQAEREATQQKAMQQSGLAAAPTETDVQRSFTDRVKQRLQQELNTNLDVATTEKEKISEKISKSILSNSKKDIQESIEALSDISGTTPSSVNAPTSGGSMQKELFKQRISALEKMQETASKTLEKEYDYMEAQYSVLPEGAVTKFSDKWRDTWGANGHAIIEQAAKDLKGVMELSQEEGGAIIPNKLKFLNEMRYLIQKKGETSIMLGKDQRKGMLSMIDDFTERMLQAKGAPEGTMRQFHDAYGNLRTIRDAVEKRTQALKYVANELEKSNPGNLHDAIFRSAGKKTGEEAMEGASLTREGIEEAFGPGAQKFETQIRELDSQIKIEQTLKNATPEEAPRLIKGISKDLVEAANHMGNDTFVIDKLVNIANKDLINSVRKGVNDPRVLKDGAMRWIRDAIERNKSKVDVSNPSFQPHEALGVTPAQWEGLKLMLGNSQSKLIEDGLTTIVNTDKAATIFSAQNNIIPSGYGTMNKIALRRIFETHFTFVQDIMNAVFKKKIEENEARAIMTSLTSSDIKDVGKLFKDVADKVKKIETPSGSKTVVKKVNMDEIYLRAGQIIESFIVANKSMSETSKLKHQQELRKYMLESQRQTLH